MRRRFFFTLFPAVAAGAALGQAAPPRMQRVAEAARAEVQVGAGTQGDVSTGSSGPQKQSGGEGSSAGSVSSSQPGGSGQGGGRTPQGGSGGGRQ